MVTIPESVSDGVHTVVSDIETPMPLLVIEEGPPSGTFSVLPSAQEDPPEEHALILRDPRWQPRDDVRAMPVSSGESEEPEGDKIMKKQSVFCDVAMMNEVRRERTESLCSWTSADRSVNADSAEPEGDKVCRKRSMFGDAVLKKDGRPGDGANPQSDLDPVEEGIEDSSYYHNSSSERMLSEPEGLTADEAEETKRSRRRRKHGGKKSSSSRSSRPETGRAAEREAARAPAAAEPLVEDASDDTDDSSILTQDPPGYGEPASGVPPPAGNPYADIDDDEAASSSSRQRSPSPSPAKDAYYSIKRNSEHFVRDGVSSDEGSFNIESDEDESYAIA